MPPTSPKSLTSDMCRECIDKIVLVDISGRKLLTVGDQTIAGYQKVPGSFCADNGGLLFIGLCLWVNRVSQSTLCFAPLSIKLLTYGTWTLGANWQGLSLHYKSSSRLSSLTAFHQSHQNIMKYASTKCSTYHPRMQTMAYPCPESFRQQESVLSRPRTDIVPRIMWHCFPKACELSSTLCEGVNAKARLIYPSTTRPTDLAVLTSPCNIDRFSARKDTSYQHDFQTNCPMECLYWLSTVSMLCSWIVVSQLVINTRRIISVYQASFRYAFQKDLT